MSDFVYLISSDRIGNQDPELGKTLMQNFLRKLIQANEKPSRLLFVERGVQLLTPEYPGIDALKILEEMGIELLACQTCLDYYKIRDKFVVGKVSNMPDIIEAMHFTDKVINL